MKRKKVAYLSFVSHMWAPKDAKHCMCPSLGARGRSMTRPPERGGLSCRARPPRPPITEAEALQVQQPGHGRRGAAGAAAEAHELGRQDATRAAARALQDVSSGCAALPPWGTVGSVGRGTRTVTMARGSRGFGREGHAIVNRCEVCRDGRRRWGSWPPRRARAA